MRLRNVKNAREKLEASSFFIKDPEKMKGSWPKDQTIHLEIGTGKGDFLIGMAKSYPDILFVGVEKYESVLVRAVEKTEDLELNNLKFICYDATKINDIFDHEIDTLYLNFSDPWPKDRHAKRRLPSRQFLARYDQILDKNGTIEFKTDNRGLFDFALEEIEPAGWRLLMHTFDLHADTELMKDNIMTEYEEKFVAKGNPICMLQIFLQEDK